MKRGPASELRPCPRNGVFLGKEAVLADSGREGEVVAGVGWVRSLAILSILRVVRIIFLRQIPSSFRPS